MAGAKLLKWKWFLLLNIVALLFLVFAFGREYVGNLQIEGQISLLQAEKTKLEKQKLATLDLMSELSSEYYLEKEGRTKQGLGKDGETLVVIDEEAVSGPADATSQLVELANPMRWFYYFFNPVEFERLSQL